MVSARESIKSYETDPAYKELRETLPLDDVIDYIGDYDSISSLVLSLEDDYEEGVTVGVGAVLADFDRLFGKLCEFNEEYMAEVAPQLERLGVVYNRDVAHAACTTGGRVLLGVGKEELKS